MAVNVPTESEAAPSELRGRLERVRAEIERALESVPSPDRERAAEVFAAELHDLLGDEEVDEQIARRAARIALAELAWRHHLGTLLRAHDVAELLGVTKQRVSAIATAGRLIALHARDGSVGYPAWQFAEGRVLEPLAVSHRTLASTGSEWSAASWCVEPHPELEGRSPVHWAAKGGDPDALVLVAQRDAARLAA